MLPDAAVRVVLLDFETLPPKREEAEGVVRFRLKKSLPFDVDKGQGFLTMRSPPVAGVRVIAAVALMNVIEDYEAAFRQAGFEPGAVMPSMLAALGAANAPQPSLVIKVDARTTSIAILDGQQLLLFRTLENPRGVDVTGEQLAEEIYPSVVFFQDTYQLNIAQIFVAGLPESGWAPKDRAIVTTAVSASGMAATARLSEIKSISRHSAPRRIPRKNTMTTSASAAAASTLPSRSSRCCKGVRPCFTDWIRPAIVPELRLHARGRDDHLAVAVADESAGENHIPAVAE